MANTGTVNDKRERLREDARVQVKLRIVNWYVEQTGRPPENQCEDKKAYGGKVHWWLEPTVPKVSNPILIEEAIGDGWALRVGVLGIDT